MTLRNTFIAGTIAAGIALASATVAPMAFAAPNPSPCYNGGTSCLAAPEHTDEEITLFCAGGILVNREKGTNYPIPEWCPENLKKQNGQ